MRDLTKRDLRDIEAFQNVTGRSMRRVEDYISGDLEWHELWDFNFSETTFDEVTCKCKLEGIKKGLRRKGYPHSIESLERLGLHFTALTTRKSWYEPMLFQCTCGQKWKETFVQSQQYEGHHAYPVTDE